MVFDKNLLKASIEADAKKKADKKAENAGDPIANLKNLVTELEPVRGDKFSTAKTAKFTKLTDAVAAYEADSAASDELKSIIDNLKPFLIAEVGAAARKAEMLSVFPATPVTQSADATNDETPGTTPEAQS